MWHYTNPKNESKVRTLVSFVKVLAVNGITDPSAKVEPNGDNTATLLVSQDDASRIELAEKEGNLSLSLYGGSTAHVSETAREATLPELYDPSDIPQGEVEGTLITTSNSGAIVEWKLKKRSWERELD